MKCEKENNLRSRISFSWEFYNDFPKMVKKEQNTGRKLWQLKNIDQQRKNTISYFFRLLHLQNFKSCWLFLLFTKIYEIFCETSFSQNITFSIDIKYRVSKFIFKLINPTLPKIVSRKWRSSIALSWDLHKFQHRKLFLLEAFFLLDWNLCKSSSEIK